MTIFLRYDVKKYFTVFFRLAHKKTAPLRCGAAVVGEDSPYETVARSFHLVGNSYVASAQTLIASAFGEDVRQKGCGILHLLLDGTTGAQSHRVSGL